ncbi:MAG: type III-A CRISPR-associated protein Cas10/Csm1 [bacterium]
MNNFSDSFKVVLASLFYDIGKVRQRSGKAIENRDNEQSAHTAQSIDDADLSDMFPFLKDLASSHHKKDLSGLESIIQKADHLASGLDRDDQNSNNIGAEQKNENQNIYKEQSNYKLRRLNPIFSQINLSDVDAKPENNIKTPTLVYDVDILNYKTEPYSIDDNLKDYKKEEAEKHYLSLYERYIKDLKKIIFVGSNFNEKNYITSLMYLNEKYFSLVPASCYKTSPESSLADHSIAVAAIANSLLNQQKLKSNENSNNHDNSLNADNSKENNFCLIQGDFSGIQDFIFSLKGDSNKYVAKILRARSFFVSMITENIAHRLCKKLDLMPSSIVLNAGGKFVILSQNFTGLNNVINEFKQSIKKEMESLTFGKTKFVIASHDFSKEYFEFGKFYKVYEGLALKFEEAKLRYIHDRYVYDDYINNVSKANNEVCDICGEHPADSYMEEEDLHICGICREFKKNGENIPKTNLIELNLDSDLTTNPIDLIHSIKLKNDVGIRNNNIIDLSNSLSNSIKNNDYLYFDITDYDNEFMGIAKKRIANYIPVFAKEDQDDTRYKKLEERYKDKLDKIDEGLVKTFYHIAASSLNISEKNISENKADNKKENNNGVENQKITGKDFLGVLKADIDNMGQIFINGFKKPLNEKNQQNNNNNDKPNVNINNAINLPRIISLSRMIDYFFTFKIQKLIKDKYKNVYTVFSGGDDLFLIGNYKEIIELWEDINEKFKEFIGDNKYIHVSYSIFLIKPSVPFTKMADIAEEELTAAKKLDGKDAIKIFNITMHNDELKEILEKYDKYKFIYNATSVQFIYKVLTFIEMEKNLKNKKSILENARWKALLRYHIIRKIDENKKIDESVKNSMNEIGYDIEKFSEKLKVLLSLIIYENRK